MQYNYTFQYSNTDEHDHYYYISDEFSCGSLWASFWVSSCLPVMLTQHGDRETPKGEEKKRKKYNMLQSLWKVLHFSILLYLLFIKWGKNTLCMFENRQWIQNWFVCVIVKGVAHVSKRTYSRTWFSFTVCDFTVLVQSHLRHYSFQEQWAAFCSRAALVNHMVENWSCWGQVFPQKLVETKTELTESEYHRKTIILEKTKQNKTKKTLCIMMSVSNN